jgi:hypothetical protein
MLKLVPVICLFVFSITSSVNAAVNTGANPGDRVITFSTSAAVLAKEAAIIYDTLSLEELGLDIKAFKYAWKGYVALRSQGKLNNTDILTICDFSQSSRNRRMYVIDLLEMQVTKHTYVAHGRGSGAEFARYFSNTPESHKSSLGFYITGETYFGSHGLSLRINGIERGINDKAFARRIVVHGSKYVGDDFLEKNPFTGRSFGCPALASDETQEIIDMIKDGSCLFIYHPSSLYISKSKILNG